MQIISQDSKVNGHSAKSTTADLVVKIEVIDPQTGCKLIFNLSDADGIGLDVFSPDGELLCSKLASY